MAKIDVSINRHQSWCEVRTNDDGTLDEIVTGQIEAFHLEQMDDGCWWFALYAKDGTRQVGTLRSKKRIKANTFAE